MSGGIIGKPKYDDTVIDISYPHILKAPYRSVMAPRSDKIDTSDINNEIYETKEYMSDRFNAIPQGTNIAASIGYGHSINSSNSALKKMGKNKPKGFQGAEPFWTPEGGFMVEYSDKKLPEDYYAENRRPVRYTTLNPIEERWEDPMIMFSSSKGKMNIRESNNVTVIPTAVYEFGMPEFEGRKPIVYKSTSSVTGMSVDFDPEDIPNPTQISKYIQSKNLFNILTPMYSTFIKLGEKVIPIKLKDPNYIALQAQSSLPIDIPLPDGTNIKLKDYRWIVVQNVNSESELIFEIPVKLKERPDIAHSISKISSAYENYTHQKGSGKIQHNRIQVSNSAPVVDQRYNNQYLDSKGRPAISTEEEHIRFSNSAPVVDQRYNNQYLESKGRPAISTEEEHIRFSNSAPVVDQRYNNQYLDSKGRPAISTEEHINVSANVPIVDQRYNQYLETLGTPTLSNSKYYSSVDNALEAIPGKLVPVRAEIREKPQINVQPSPGFTMPWTF